MKILLHNFVKNSTSILKPSRAIRLLLMVLFVLLLSNVASAQTASSTWALTGNGNPTNVGNVTGTTIAFGSGLNSPVYDAIGVNTGSWSKDAPNLKNDEYYEFSVTPNPNNLFNVTVINFEHSRSKGNWKVQAYYSTDNFATRTPISAVFNSDRTTPTANNNAVNIGIENVTLTVRIYGWESDGDGTNQLRLRNVVISGTTCTKSGAPATIGASRCGTGSVSLTASGATSGQDYKWYSDLTSGILLQTGGTAYITPSISTTTTYYASIYNTTGTTCQSSARTAAIATINSPPSPITVTPSAVTIPCNTIQTLVASQVAYVTVLNENFNGSVTGWTQYNSSSGGTVANADWKLYLDGGGFNSNDATNFIASNSNGQRGTNTATELWSPSFNLTGLSTASLEFYQYYKYNSSETAKVEISTDGGTVWTNLATYTSTQGAPTIFQKTTIDLTIYVGNPNVKLRFKYNATNDFYWLIDNVKVTGTSSVNYTWSPIANLYSDAAATMPYVANTPASTVYTKTSVTTVYTATATALTTGCTATATSTITIAIAEAKWNGSTWTNGPPNNTKDLVFNGNYSVVTDLEGCSCKVSSGTVTVKSGSTLKISNGVTVEGLGSLIFENNASLVQINSALNQNFGNIEYQRSTNSVVRKTDYVYWSSPVFHQVLGLLSAKTANGTFYSFDTSTENWNQAYDETLMDIGKGYIVRRPDFISGIPVVTETYTAYFIGVPNNGTIIIPSGFSGAAQGTSNLLGNPYPSAIDADKFLDANTGIVDGTLYFWTHNTAIQNAGNIGYNTDGSPKAGSGALAFTSDDYASYNRTGGAGTAAAIGSGINKNIPSGKIASGQGFFATSTGLGDVKFTNDMRVAGTSGNNSQFFKTKNLKGKTDNTFEKNRLWLNLTNAKGAFKQTLIGYVTDATNEYDSRFDGESFDANEFVDFYSVSEDKNLVIQGRALPFREIDEVPLGYRTTIDGTFTINIDEVDGLLTDQAVFIEDKLTNTVFNLKSGNYTFSTAPGTFNDRFVLKYMDISKTLTEDTIEKEDGILAFYSTNYNTLIIHNDNFNATVNSVALFNMAGQKIGVWNVSDSEQTNIQVPIKNISSGIYIVKVSTTKGESSKKIMVN